ncbi:GNAT family N-acetyltransferase [bacterium]|nr:GNAT family N-acetyltransferase [bacterium]
MKLKTKNLYVRDYMESDLYNLFFCMSKEDVCRYLSFKPYKSIEEAQKELNIRLKESKYYAITLLNKKYIGEIYLSKDDDAYEIRFLLDDLYWKNGYMTEAIVAVTNYFIENKGAYKFIAYVNKNNIAACNVLERVGFVKIKETNDIVYEL